MSVKKKLVSIICALTISVNSALYVNASSDNPCDSDYSSKNISFSGDYLSSSVNMSSSKYFKKSWRKPLRVVSNTDYTVYTLWGKHNYYWVLTDTVKTELDYYGGYGFVHSAGIVSGGKNKWSTEKYGGIYDDSGFIDLKNNSATFCANVYVRK